MPKRVVGQMAIGLGMAIAVTALAGCKSTSSAGVFSHARPNEFAVTREAPLVVPPDFTLAPPRPGVPRPQEADPSTQALQAMFGGQAPRSDTERALLDKAGADRADPGIRSTVADPATNVVDKGSMTQAIIAAPQGQGQDAKVSTPQ